MRTTLALVIGLMSISCGNAGESDTSSLGPTTNIRGAILGQTGGQGELVGFQLGLLDKSTEVMRFATVGNGGLYEFKNIYTDRVYSMVLLSPNFIISGVMAQPIAGRENRVSQFFGIQDSIFPGLSVEGNVLRFNNEEGVSFTGDFATSSDNNSIPDGVKSLQLTKGQEEPGVDEERLALVSSRDFDNDGIPNSADPDIDGDGVFNGFDSDDDGDGVFDPVDPDSDGDLIQDITQAQHDLYYPEGVEYATVKFEMKFDDQGQTITSLYFETKLREGVNPLGVQIQGPDSLLDGAKISDPENPDIQAAWDGLLDKSEVAARVYSKFVTLETGTTPLAHQVVLFQLGFGNADDPWFLSFPYTFSPLEPQPLEGRYDGFTGIFSRFGNPFGTSQDYEWLASVLRPDEDTVLWTSPAVLGNEATLKMPENLRVDFASQDGVRFRITAKTLDRIPNNPAYVIQSEVAPLNP